jgi:predicted nucleic acid-binding protein
MIRILVDTCVWIDLAKDYHQKLLIGLLDELVENEAFSLIVPRITVEEFEIKKKLLKKVGKVFLALLKELKM